MITLPVRIGLRHDRLDLGDGNRGEEFHEKNKECKKQSKRTNEGHNVKNGGRVIVPRARDKVARQRNCNYKTLEPHTNVDEDRKHEGEHEIRTEFLNPEELRRNYVACDHDPVSPCKWTKCAVYEGKCFVGCAAVPGNEELG